MKLLNIFKTLVLISTVFFLSACGESTEEKVKNLAVEYTKALCTGNADYVFKNTDFGDDLDSDKEEFAHKKIESIVNKNKEKTDKKGGINKIEAQEPIFSEDKTMAKVLIKITYKTDDDSKDEEITLKNDGSNNWKVLFK
jgi:hypothetical protein